MQAQSSGDKQYYEAEGEWNLLGSGDNENRQMKVVAGACNAPNALILPFRYRLDVTPARHPLST